MPRPDATSAFVSAGAVKIRREIPYTEIIRLLDERDRKIRFMKARVKQDRTRLEHLGLYELKLRDVRVEQHTCKVMRLYLRQLRYRRVEA